MTEAIIVDFQKAVKKLEEVLTLPKTEVNRDSAIKRFELCFDLSWKSIKLFAKTQGVECYSPKNCFKVAFQLHLIDYDERWLEMVDDRNITAHLYKEEYAGRVYSLLPEYLQLFKDLLIKLSSAD